MVINNHHCLESEVKLCLNNILKKRMAKKKKKTKTRKSEKGISLEKIPYTITKFYKGYKKRKTY